VPKVQTKAEALTAHEQFAALHADTADRLATLAHEWAAGEWSSGTWAAEMDAILLDAHTQAVVIGRSHAGDDAPEEADDREFARPIVESEHAFLQPFVDQMEAGTFTSEDGTRDGEAVAARAVLYSGRLTGTANQAFTATLPPEAEVWWILGAEDDSNCESCPAIADGSPYPASSFDIWPGSNSTPCLSSCRCRLETADGVRGFQTPD
jgi:hypothetical protein